MTDKATYWWQRGSIKNSETTRSIKRQLYWERSVSIWKTKYIFTLVLLPGIYSVWWETGHKKNCPKIDTASLSKKALNKKQPRGLLRKLWVNKGLHMSDCYSEEVRTVILTQTRAWTNLRNMEEIKENIWYHLRSNSKKQQTHLFRLLWDRYWAQWGMVYDPWVEVGSNHKGLWELSGVGRLFCISIMLLTMKGGKATWRW